MSEIVLSLDVSTKTGWAVIESDGSPIPILMDHGGTVQIKEPQGNYPNRVLDWSRQCFAPIEKLIVQYKPNVIVIEQTSKGSKNSNSQKILEWIHYILADYLVKNNLKSVYLQTGEWKKLVGSKMTSNEKDRNKYIKDYIKKYKAEHGQEYTTNKNGKKKKKAVIVYDENGERIGKVGKKNVSIRTANEIFGSQLKIPFLRKNEDEAEATLLCAAYHFRKINKKD